MTTIRLAPSGPQITSDDGAPADVGAGFRLRLVESTDAQATSRAITTLTDVGDEIALPLPDARAQYAIDGFFAVANTSGSTRTLTVRVQTDDGNGGAWLTHTTHTYAIRDGQGQTICCSHALSTLPITSGPELRCRIAAEADGAGVLLTSGEPWHVRLEECF
jgi:hypothetical protein